MITTFHLSRPDPAVTDSERYRQPLAEHNYSTGTMANQLIRVFLKFNFMALQHQDKQSLMLLWVNELYPLCLQLLNSLARVIECCTFNLPQGPSFAVGCRSHSSLEHVSALFHLSCEKRLREFGLLRLDKKRLQKDLTATFQYLKGA